MKTGIRVVVKHPNGDVEAIREFVPSIWNDELGRGQNIVITQIIQQVMYSDMNVEITRCKV